MTRAPFIAMDESAVALVRRVLPFAAKVKYRPMLGCVAFDRDAVVATDSYRLAIGWIDEPELPRGVVPASWLAAVLPDGYDWIVPRGALPWADLDDFPTWRGLLDQFRWTTRIGVRRSELLAATAMFARKRPDKGDYPVLRIEFDAEHVRLFGLRTSRSRDDAEYLGRCDVTYDGPVPLVPLAVNARFFRDALTASTLDDDFTFEVDDYPTHSSPGICNPVSIREPGFSQILMPVRCA